MNGLSEKQATVVLIHAAWADGSSWNRVMPLLCASGHCIVKACDRCGPNESSANGLVEGFVAAGCRCTRQRSSHANQATFNESFYSRLRSKLCPLCATTVNILFDKKRNVHLLCARTFLRSCWALPLLNGRPEGDASKKEFSWHPQ